MQSTVSTAPMHYADVEIIKDYTDYADETKEKSV
jgi:hypothetical protein